MYCEVLRQGESVSFASSEVGKVDQIAVRIAWGPGEYLHKDLDICCTSCTHSLKKDSMQLATPLFSSSYSSSQKHAMVMIS